MLDKQFRFQDFEIWKKAADLGVELFEIADKLEKDHKYRFAEQLRAAALSVSNNIAEGSGSVSDVDFRNFLNIARRSVFEVANILVMLARCGYLSDDQVLPLLDKLREESQMILGFMRSLK